MEMKHKLQGLRLYRFIDGEESPRIIRIIKANESKGIYTCLDYNTDEKKILKLPAEEVDNEWIKLNPDGIIAFSEVEAKTNEGDITPDVMVRFHRINKDGGYNIDTIPFAICRQSVIDIFALIQQNRYIAGMSISENTCPPEVKYEGCCAFTRMLWNVNIAYYLDDTMDNILECFDHKRINDALSNIRYRSKMKNQVVGYVEDIKDLVHDNYFMLDVHDGVKIAEFPTVKSFDFEDKGVNKMITEHILSNLQEVPTRFYPRPYTKYIDLSDIEKRYILISPDSRQVHGRNGQITLVAYDVSATISFKDYINKGRSVERAKREIMAALGWE